VAEFCDALWNEGDPKSFAAARDLLDATGAVALPVVGVTIVVGSNADAGVYSVVDEEGVPLAASLDVGILGFMVEDENQLAAAPSVET
jgi:hypothetical protein